MSLDKKENPEGRLILYSKIKRKQPDRCRIYQAESCRIAIAAFQLLHLIRPFVCIRLLIIQHDYCIGEQLERSASESDTYRSILFRSRSR